MPVPWNRNELRVNVEVPLTLVERPLFLLVMDDQSIFHSRFTRTFSFNRVRKSSLIRNVTKFLSIIRRSPHQALHRLPRVLPSNHRPKRAMLSRHGTIGAYSKGVLQRARPIVPRHAGYTRHRRIKRNGRYHGIKTILWRVLRYLVPTKGQRPYVHVLLFRIGQRAGTRRDALATNRANRAKAKGVKLTTSSSSTTIPLFMRVFSRHIQYDRVICKRAKRVTSTRKYHTIYRRRTKSARYLRLQHRMFQV